MRDRRLKVVQIESEIDIEWEFELQCFTKNDCDTDRHWLVSLYMAPGLPCTWIVCKLGIWQNWTGTFSMEFPTRSNSFKLRKVEKSPSNDEESSLLLLRSICVNLPKCRNEFLSICAILLFDRSSLNESKPLPDDLTCRPLNASGCIEDILLLAKLSSVIPCRVQPSRVGSDVISRFSQLIVEVVQSQLNCFKAPNSQGEQELSSGTKIFATTWITVNTSTIVVPTHCNQAEERCVNDILNCV